MCFFFGQNMHIYSTGRRYNRSVRKGRHGASPAQYTAHTHSHPGASYLNQPRYWHVFGQWKETGEHRRNPHGHHRQKPERKLEPCSCEAAKLPALTDRQTGGQPQRERQTAIETREKQTDRERERNGKTDSERDRQKQRKREWLRQRKLNRQTQRGWETDRGRERNKQTDRHKGRERNKQTDDKTNHILEGVSSLFSPCYCPQ